MSHHKIEAKNLVFKYQQGIDAINDVSFTITHGESVGILGANGAGKSTLLLLIMGVLTPDSGQVLVGDVIMTKKTMSDIRRHLGLVFQNPDDQLFMNTIYEDVAFGPQNMKLSEDEVSKRVEDALAKTNIRHLSKRAPYNCSGGEKRAAAIATILSMTPDMLILDEPTNALDPRARQNTIKLLDSFSHTKIIASHDINMIQKLCERTIILAEGKVYADGKTNEMDLEEWCV